MGDLLCKDVGQVWVSKSYSEVGFVREQDNRALACHPSTSDTKYRRECGGTGSPTKKPVGATIPVARATQSPKPGVAGPAIE
ncbi:MAG: hypothetical protein FWC40_03425, partial [Proteobacteria bacterium]|nr:hypothetical protein [Pseudomonadota bacterium]